MDGNKTRTRLLLTVETFVAQSQLSAGSPLRYIAKIYIQPLHQLTNMTTKESNYATKRNPQIV